MPKVLPSFDLPRANRVRSGSAVVTACETRDRGVSRSAGPDDDAGGVSGRPLKLLSGAGGVGDGGVGCPAELPPGGSVSPKFEAGGVVL